MKFMISAMRGDTKPFDLTSHKVQAIYQLHTLLEVSSWLLLRGSCSSSGASIGDPPK